jgi:hypothetical protein
MKVTWLKWEIQDELSSSIHVRGSFLWENFQVILRLESSLVKMLL